MGFFDAIKKAFDSGGIKLRLDTPNTFKWANGSIPVTVTLRGHKTEPRTVTQLRFTFQEERKDEDNDSISLSNRENDVSLTVTRSEPIVLQPMEKITVEMDFPLATGGEKGSASSIAGKAMDAMSMFSSDEKWYVLTVHSKVEGAKQEKSTSDRIRSAGVGIGLSFGKK